MSLRFAKKCLRNEKIKDLFPMKKFKHKMKKRNSRKYETKQINTKRFERSALPYMTNLLNKHEEEKRKMMKNI